MGDVISTIFWLGILGVVLWVAVGWLRRLVQWGRHQYALESGTHPGTPGADLAVAGGEALDDKAREVLGAASARMREKFGDQWMLDDRRTLQRDGTFTNLVGQVRDLDLPTEVLVSLAGGYDAWLARVVLPVLAERDDIPDRWLLMAIRRLEAASYDLAGMYLLSLEKAPGEVIGNVLAKAEDVRADDLAALISARVRSGRETVDADLMRRHVPLAGAETIQTLLESYELPESARASFAQWLENALDFGEVGRFVKLRTRPFSDGQVLVEGRRADVADEILASLEEHPPRSVLLVGEHGVGKSALVDAALDRLPDGWIVFEAGAAQINADAMYVGQLEGRIEDLVQRLRGKPAVWIFPAFEEALYSGTYSQHPTGMLDLLLPHIEAGTIRLVAEITPQNYELLAAKRPRVQSALRGLRLRVPTEAETVEILAHALEHDDADVSTDELVLREVYELAQQFLPGIAQPGGSMSLLEATVDAAVERDATTFDAGDVLASLAALSGLPLALLDPNRPLDLDAVRAFFGKRVLGQDEAVGVIVDRIALVKAGLTDPTRPLGVFLFVGPTGTGKTELAKSLAEFMFGSVNRLVRLDMSEFQTPDSLDRLLSDTSVDPTGAALIASVRKDPFSVILLDEFEKAAPPIWDLFLQVFDDGRLTDRTGRTTDFRRCLVILTSNVGSALQSGPALGFSPDATGFQASDVQRAIERHFRPEFLNRIDKILTFRPFGREQMRALLEKELNEVVRRRGIRGKPWALEVDESAVTLLLEAGFSPTLGARPLKRAVEAILLTPLARTIVDAQVPEGDQFLFVTAPRGKVEVRFVDPDADDTTEPVAAEREAARDLDLRSLALTPRATAAVADFLLDDFRRVQVAVEREVEGRKDAGLEEMSRPGFWDDEARFEVLADIEYLDRLEAAFGTAERLGARLRAQSTRGGQVSTELVGLLAGRLYVLDAALTGLAESAPRELYLRVRPVGGADEQSAEFVRTLCEMYGAWAAARGMRFGLLDGGVVDVAHVSGLGAGAILEHEAGLHVLELVGAETSEGDRPVDRVVVSVELASREAGAVGRGEDVAVEELFRDLVGSTEIVRRYRPGASPLVRDAVRGYRTGRLDRVLAGDFDLF